MADSASYPTPSMLQARAQASISGATLSSGIGGERFCGCFEGLRGVDVGAGDGLLGGGVGLADAGLEFLDA